MSILQDPYVIKVGLGCNNNCKFCLQAKRIPFRKTGDSIRKELKEARRQGFSYVIFEGGEPTIRNDICNYIIFAKLIGFRQVDIQSNGRMFFYNEFCQKLVRSGIDTFVCALHGHTKDMHDFLTSAPGSFKQTVQGIRNLKALGQKVGNQLVISKINFCYLPQITSFLINLKIDRLQFDFIQPLGMAAKNLVLLVPRLTEVVPYVKRAIDIAKKSNTYVGTMGIPHCLLGDYAEYAQEFKRARRGLRTDNLPFKCKGFVCRRCLHTEECEGPWASYVKYFGWEEIKPTAK